MLPDGCWTGFLQVKYQLRNHHSVAPFSLPEATKNIGIRMPKRSRGLRSMLSLASPEKEMQDQISCTRNSEFSILMQFKS